MVNFQKEMAEFFNNSCLALSYAYLEGMRNEKDIIFNAVKGWYNCFIEDDGFVSSPIEYLKQINPHKNPKDIRKVFIDSLSALGEGEYVVEYTYNNKSHFVVATNAGVVFDPSGISNSVKKGVVKSYRKIIY